MMRDYDIPETNIYILLMYFRKRFAIICQRPRVNDAEPLFITSDMINDAYPPGVNS